ncbi:MAG TPA: FAD-dependent monooxygenase [Usitatibacter sp.]|jgi:2-polyprenyl-6-methoxyphenol hydroxylase-like FAD-dependent oxidoreductase|nr:FAD-dependent monooxygenase [Usitatibacter sp.]
MNDHPPDSEVLIAGAGPTGLVLALWLTRYGIPVRVVDKAPRADNTSRALAVHTRTLELYQPMGLAQPVIEASHKLDAVNLWVAGRKRARARFGDMGKGLSPYPYSVIYPQDEHEKLLIERLEAAGVRVEREVEVVGIEDDREHFVSARLRHRDGTESRARCAFLAGCDGAHSFVRGAVHAGFPGGTYEHIFYVADVEATGPVTNGELNGALDAADFILVFPLRAEGHVRLVGTVRDDAAKRRGELRWEDVSKDILERMRIDVRKVNWFSTYHVHHRVANEFRDGRVFILGDAAHIHSPVGGQGMNTGIGDAINLAWKLAAMLKGRGAEAILDTYSTERRAFAMRLVASTDRAFTFVTREGAAARFVRLHLVPWLVPFAVRFDATLRFMFRTISQTSIEYRPSALSQGHAGAIHAGDRLPWVAPSEGTRGNFAPLDSMDWQVHVHGEAPRAIAQACERHGIALHAFAWQAAASHAGYERNAAYLVRPDAYVGWAGAGEAVQGFEAYLARHRIAPLG